MKHSITTSAQLSWLNGDPRASCAHWREQPGPAEALLLVDFDFTAYWHEAAPPQALTAIYYRCGTDLLVAVTDQLLTSQSLSPRDQYLHWCAQHRLVSFDPARPLGLAPMHIAKPWGREIWYTGVERRGVCDFACGEARSPIPWLQTVVPRDAIGRPGEPLVLLKILDPYAQPELGDLYFELHETKREVYVVTRIDRQAWPDGVGFIRYGFDPALLASYSDEEQFRADYLAAVQAYEAQRRVLDGLPGRGMTPDAAHLARERLLRERMNRFTHLRPLRPGDVVQVPPLLPHALQHGVRTVEFQTPTYERKILSFGQKVLTQDHWDTREAVAQMRLTPATGFSPGEQFRSEGVVVEQIAVFADFEVLRATLPAGTRWQFDCGEGYCLVMVVTGILALAGASYEPERALLLPRSWRGPLAAPEAVPSLVLLLARPLS